MYVHNIKTSVEHPYKNANIVSKLFFLWLIKYFRNIKKRNWELSDLPKTLEETSAKYLGEKLQLQWEIEQLYAKNKYGSPSIYNALKKVFFWEYVKLSLMEAVVFLIFKPFQIVLLSIFLNLFEKNVEDKTKQQWFYGSILFLSVFSNILLHQNSLYNSRIQANKIQTSLTSVIYRKVLKINQTALNNYSVGKVVNVLSNDLNYLDEFCTWSKMVFITPLQILVVIFLLQMNIGNVLFVGIVFLLIYICITRVFLDTIVKTIRLKLSQNTDARIKLMNEIISGIKVIKMYAWEKPFEKIIELYRSKEMNYISKHLILSLSIIMFMKSIQKTMLFLIIWSYWLLTNHITAAIVFSTMQYLSLIVFSGAYVITKIIYNLSEVKVTIKRIDDFLTSENKHSILKKTALLGEIIVEDLETWWDSSSFKMLGKKFHVQPGNLCAIIGPVGAGKSTLLQILLSELKSNKGKITLKGSISYCSQDAWLFNSSVRKNILFGEKYHEEKYNEIIKVCALEKDFQQFSGGDSSLVGEKGVSLSGGQKARVNLARALYKEADIYLLDDPLAAVDANVGKHIYENCIKMYLKNKTRILVTHHVQYLKDVDVIYVVNEGRIEKSVTYEELLNENHNYVNLLSVDDKNYGTKFCDIDLKVTDFEKSSSFSEDISMVIVDKKETDKLSLLWIYFRLGSGYCYGLLTIFVIILVQFILCSTDFVLAYWTNLNQKSHTEFEFLDTTNTTINLTSSYNHKNSEIYSNDVFYLRIYFDLILAGFLFQIIKMLMTNRAITNSSKKLHNKMFHCLLKTPIQFFSNHPVGEILNRFSKDMGNTDQTFPKSMLEAEMVLSELVGSFILMMICGKYNVLTIIVVFVVLILVLKILVRYSTRIKLLETQAKSPVFSHLNYTLLGLSTIRACKKENILIEEFNKHQDIHTSADTLLISCFSTFSVFVDTLISILIGSIIYTYILVDIYISDVSSSDVGLSLSQALGFLGIIQFGLKKAGESINDLTSVERVLEYTTLDKEGPFRSTDTTFIEKWAQNGKIEFRNVYLKYTKNYILTNLSFIIEPNQKVGIVGRTGAGKSSLVSILFRLANFEGSVLIDNFNIKDIGLTDLRTKISVIPQEPILFSDSIRFNLDPFSEFTDKDVWKALEEVDLKNSIQSLDCMITEGGNNFSVGQRQLLCLARAILRKSKILVMDEATANIDLKTDEFIKNTIKTKFEDCTVLTIAHRLATIMDSDKVLVMDGGNLIEFDHPYLLIKNKSSMFYNLVFETGMEGHLATLAHNNFLRSL